MSRATISAFLSLVLSILLVQVLRSADQTLITAGSLWRYNDTGVNLGTAWREAGYSDGAWATGAAQLGYGDGDETTELSFGSSGGHLESAACGPGFASGTRVNSGGFSGAALRVYVGGENNSLVQGMSGG